MVGFVALGADRSGSAGFVVGSAAIPPSGSLLGADHDFGNYAVLTGRGARCFVAAFCGNCFGRGGWGDSGELFRAKRARIRVCRSPSGVDLRSPAVGSSLLSFWRYNPGDRDVGAEGRFGMANRVSSVRGGVDWNWSGAGLDRRMARNGVHTAAQKINSYEIRLTPTDS